LYEARGPARGDERLSAKYRGKLDDAGARKGSSRRPSPESKARKQKSSELGRALRSIYDDTLRETVPDDFLDLLGKLS